jgi:hypothetical protein
MRMPTQKSKALIDPGNNLLAWIREFMALHFCSEFLNVPAVSFGQ